MSERRFWAEVAGWWALLVGVVGWPRYRLADGAGPDTVGIGLAVIAAAVLALVALARGVMKRDGGTR